MLCHAGHDLYYRCPKRTRKNSPSFTRNPTKKSGPKAARPFYLKEMSANTRPDREGAHRTAFEKNKRKILLTQEICAICGRPVDKSLKYPHPLSPTVDHIIPVSRGGHPSDIDNLQLAHFTCNRQKWDKIIDVKPTEVKKDTISNRVLPLSMDWSAYKG